jgi:hypothetical protein
MKLRPAIAALICGWSAWAGGSEDWTQLKLTAVPEWPRLPPGWTFEETPGVTVDGRGHVFVFHRGPRPIMEFDPAGELVRAWGDGSYVRPHAVRFDREGQLWLVDDGGHVVVRLDAAGRARMVLGRKGTPAEDAAGFNRPTDVAFGRSGDIYVADGYVNSRVVKFDREGRFVSTWGHNGRAPGEFNLPHAIVVDDRGRVIVGDRDNFRVQVFDADGKFLTQWTHVGSPWGLALAGNGELFLCDGYANRVLKLNLEGEVLGVYAAPGRLPGRLDFAHHLAVGPDGSLYVAEIKNWRVQKFQLSAPLADHQPPRPALAR